MKVLMGYPFPGNVRELENLVERCMVLGNATIGLNSLPAQVLNYDRASVAGNAAEFSDEGLNLESYLDDIEKRFLMQALAKSKGVKKKAASLLGMTFRSFRYRLAKFGMDGE